MANEKVRVQDDLYAFVNQEWIDNAVIPDDKPTAGGFSELEKQVEELLIGDFKRISAGELTNVEPNMKKAVDLFDLARNVEKRNAEGVAPILPVLHEMDALENIASLNRKLSEMLLRDLPLPFDCSVEPDMKDTTRYAVLLSGPRVILPDATYYKEGMEAQKQALLGVWSNMTAQLLAHTDLSAEDQAQYIQDALAFDAILATLVKTSEEWSDYTAIYNPMKLTRVASMMKPIDLKKLMSDLFGDAVPDTVIVAEPRFLKGFRTLFNEENFTLYKHWAYIRKYLGSVSLLSEELREIGSTYMKVLSGVTSTSTIEKQAYGIASDVYSEVVGLYYGKTYFGEEAKKDVVEMVKEIVDTYRERVRANDFLSPETKEKAILKLDMMGVKMGYPDKADELYDNLVFDPNGSLCMALAELGRIRTKHNIGKITQKVDRSQWVMPAHMVNAGYNPMVNDVTFPAAILQAPFYSIKQSRSENLGGIGAVIGHEISHAFDNNGAKCDELGNLNNWWSKEDFRKFKSKTKAMIREFEGIELPWGKVNSSFIVSENIADNGGMAVTLQIMSRMADADYEGYFYNWAKVWCMKARPEFLQLLLQVDVHAPAVLRANMQPRNFPEWYRTFRVKKTDQMYLSPGKRVVIW